LYYLANHQKQMTILFCTEEELMLTTLEFRFRKQGWKLEVLPNNKHLEQTIQKTAPELVVIDLQMPNYQGIEIIKAIRNDMNSSLPLLVLSFIEANEVLESALNLGADDFMSKPIKPDELVLRIKRLVLKAFRSSEAV
jgi:DNA-binding response OmpR family regulator